MKHGASAVVIEKPIATTREDLSDLTQMWKSAPHVRVFCGYQKRYSALSDHIARHFRGVEAISYHCTVYETQLPAKHWYRWPVSGSRILSNGCHWIDHFLHLNDFAPVDRFHVRADADDVITCVIVLQNGAVFTMVMSDQGSARLGMRDYVELRAGDKTARIIDDHKCELDSTSRLQKVAVRSRLMSYHRMYARIGSLIATGSNGDSIHSLTSSAALILSIHEALCSQRSDHVSAVS
jgi:predicted dehydrogenase